MTRRAEFRVVGLTARDVRERTQRRSPAPRAGLLIATLSALAIVYAYGQAGPSVEVVPRVDFGDQRVGVPGHTETIRVTNRGPSTLDIDAVALEGFHLDDFVVSTRACVDSLIESGSECLIEVRFAPKGEGPRSAQLVITDNARDSPQRVTLHGVGAPLPVAVQPVKKPPPDPLPRVQITPDLLDFGRREPGRGGLGQTVRMSNVGTGALVVTAVRPSGADAQEFRVTRETCTGRTVGPGADCEVVVEFAPRTIGGRSAELLLADNAAGSPHRVRLSGTVEAGREPTALPQVEITPDPVDFGRWEVGRSGASRAVRVRNVGAGPLLVGSLRPSAADTSEFDVKSQNCTRGRIGPGEACEVVVEFIPGAGGLQNGELLLFDNAPGSPHRVKLVGVGVEARRPMPVPFPLPRVDITPTPRDGGRSRPGPVSETPPAPGVEIAPGALNFGSAVVGRARTSDHVQLRSVGTAPLQVTRITLDGANAEDFRIVEETCSRSPVRQNTGCTISVEFGPRAVGARSAVLVIADNVPGAPQRVPVTGQGTAASDPRQEERPSRVLDTRRATPRLETVRPQDTTRVTPQLETVRPLDTFRVDPKGWCCAGGNVFSDSSRTCMLRNGTFYPTKDAAQRGCPAVIR